MYKYIILVEESIYREGLTDMKDRFTEFLKISKILNLIPIEPKIYLSNNHTEKKNSLLNDYIKIPSFVLKKIPENTKEEEIFYWKLEVKIFSKTELFIQNIDKINNTILEIDFKDKFKIKANYAISKMKRPICNVHIREGDKKTNISNIENILEKYKFNTCYIMTNMENINYLNFLKKKYNIIFYKDIDLLKKIKLSGDNYQLYTIECLIRNYSNIRISSYNTTLSSNQYLPKLSNNYFHDYLDKTIGYQ